MLSSGSLRATNFIEEENEKPDLTDSEKPDNTGFEDHHKNLELRNIPEEKDETTSDEKKKEESKLIDFSPEEIRAEKWAEEADKKQQQQEQLHTEQLQQLQQQQEQQVQQENIQGQSKSEQMMVHCEKSPEKQVWSQLISTV